MIAKRLTMSIYRAAPTGNGPAGFNRPLRYPDFGVV
jgi:hypothetical protein